MNNQKIQSQQNSKTLGSRAEHMAADYLQRKGFKLLTYNYFCRGGEIDLVMQDGEVLVFIEVRLRSKNDWGSGIESITYAKRKKIIVAAQCYLQQRNLTDKVRSRFDVVALGGDNFLDKIEWIKDAFWME